MTVPTPTNKYTDITVSPWTDNGSPLVVNDQHGESNCFDGDKVNDFITSSVEDIADGAALMSFGIFVKRINTASTGLIICNRPVSGVGQYYFVQITAANKITVASQKSGGNFILSTSNAQMTEKNVWYYLSGSIDLTNRKVRIYVDGVETAYDAENTLSGSPDATFTGITSALMSDFADSFSTGFDGILSRPTYWSGTLLTPAEFSEEFDDECAAVFVPTKTFFSVDLSDEGEWTRIGSPNFVDGQIGPGGAAMDSDGVNDQIHQSEVIVDSSATEHTVGIWIKTTATSGIVISQFRANPTDFGTFTLELSGGAIASRWDGPNESNRVLSIGNTAVNDDDWHLITAVLRSPTNVDIYIDGVEDTYATENSVTGSGFTSTVNSSVNLNIGNYDPAGTSDSFYDGLSHRPAIWDSLGISLCQVLKYFNEEFALIGTGFDPVVDNPIPDQQGSKNQLFDFTFAENTFSDPGGEDLTYTATLDGGAPLPSWLTFTPATRNFNGTPLFADIGAIDIKVTATNESLLFVSDVFELDVLDNDPPVVDNPIPDQETQEGFVYDFIIPGNTFSDPDFDTLVLTATLGDDSPLPDWLNFNSFTERFSGVPEVVDVGVINLKITATDPSLNTVSDTYQLTIIEDVFAKTRDFSSVFRTLLPRGRAWYTDLSIDFKAVIEGIVRSAASVKDKFVEVYENVFPDSTNCLELWEEQFLIDATGLTNQERRDNLSTRWSAQGGQSPSYIESVLLTLGINARVYENFDRDDPTTFLIGGDSEILVNGEIIFEERIFENTCGDPETTCNGDNSVTSGEYSGFITTTKQYSVSPFSEKFVFYFIVAAPAGVTTPLDIPAALEKQFKTAILRIKPAHTRAVLNVNYV